MVKCNNAEYEFIFPKRDFMFKQCLGRKERRKCLASFLKSVIKIDVANIQIQGQVELKKYFKNDKASKLDIQAKSNKTIFDIEMQLSKSDFSCIRTMVYWSKIFLEQGEEGKVYKEYGRTVAVWIVDFELFNTESYITKLRITDEGKQVDKFECLTIYIIELPKFKKIGKHLNNMEHLWLSFLVAESQEELNRLKGKNIYVDECIREVEKMNKDEEMRELQRIWDKTHMEELNMKYEAKQEGRQEGKEEGKEEVILKMYNLKFTFNVISQIVGISEDKVKEIIEKRKIAI